MMDYQAELATARAEIKRLTAERGGLQAKIDHFIKESLETLTESEAELEKLKIAVKAERDAAVVQGLEIALKVKVHDARAWHLAIAAEIAKLTAERDAAIKSHCGTCDGSGVIDSGGVTPGDAPVDMACPECKAKRNAAFVAGLERAKELAKNFYPGSADAIGAEIAKRKEPA